MCTALRVSRGVRLADVRERAVSHASFWDSAAEADLRLVVELRDPAVCAMAFTAACERDMRACVVALLADPRVNPGAGDNAAFRMSAKLNRTEVLRLLLASSDPRIDPTADFQDAMACAVLEGRTEVVSLLLADDRVGPKGASDGLLAGAAYNHEVEVVRLLLADGRVDPAEEDNKAIRSAAKNGSAENGSAESVRLLLADARVAPAAVNNDAVRLSVNWGHAESTRALLDDPRVDHRGIMTTETFECAASSLALLSLWSSSCCIPGWIPRMKTTLQSAWRQGTT